MDETIASGRKQSDEVIAERAADMKARATKAGSASSYGRRWLDGLKNDFLTFIAGCDDCGMASEYYPGWGTEDFQKLFELLYPDEDVD